MELGWTALAFIIIAAAVAWFWQDSLAARERANAAATEACERLGLQFLDGTVAFARIALSRGNGGTLTLRRTYVFDYTAYSIERRQGFVLLAGRRVESVGYAPGESQAEPVVQARQPQRPALEGERANSDRSNVLNLQDWRARQQAQGTQGQHDGATKAGDSRTANVWDDAPAERPSDHSDRQH
jgi:hypothetical protein